MRLPDHTTTRLFSLAGSGFELDIVATQAAVVVSLTGRTHDVTGWPRASSALANMSTTDARALARLLVEAADTAEADDTRQAVIPVLAVVPTRRYGWRAA